MEIEDAWIEYFSLESRAYIVLAEGRRVVRFPFGKICGCLIVNSLLESYYSG